MKLPLLLVLSATLTFGQQPGPRGGLTGFAQRFEEIKAKATKDELYRFLWALPKGGDLHNHHEYSVPMEDWLQLATDPHFLKGNAYYTRTRVSDCGLDDTDRLQYLTLRRSSYQKLPPCVKDDFQPLLGLSRDQREAWISSLKLDRPEKGRDEFFERIVRRLGQLDRDPEIMPELLVRQLQQAAAENLLYIETQADPRSFMALDDSSMSWKEASDRYRRRLARPDAAGTGVETRLQVAVLRFSDQAERSLARAFEFVHQNRDLWVGVNLVGREDNPRGKPARFLEAFRDLRKRYFDIPLSLHAGESEFPGREVRETLLLGASRIGHGTNLITDPDTLLLLRGSPFLVEVSLVSNQLLGYTPDLSKHPFPEYLRLGIPVCLNTDDRGALDSSMTDEYFLAVTNFNLSWAEIVRIGRYSLEHSFAEQKLKQKLLSNYDRALEAFEHKYDRPEWRRGLDAVKARRSGYSRRSLGL